METLIKTLNENKQALIMSFLSALITGVVTNFFGQTNWILKFLIVSIIVFIIIQFYQFYRKIIVALDDGRRKGILTFSFLCLPLIAFAIWDNFLGPYESQFFISEADVRALICGHHWITYEPLSYNPYQSPNPNITMMDMELQWIHNAGFDGIITFTSRDNFSEIPELAQKHDLRVIMGIWNPNDLNEVTLAISKRELVDAYVIGHNGLYNLIAGNPNLYTKDDLIRVIRYVRYKTGRPVSTTEMIQRYIDNPFLYSIGDWVFPDAHIKLKADMNANYVNESIKYTLEIASAVSEQAERGEKPILLKMVTFPHNGFSGATYTSQAEFYRLLLDSKRDTITDMSSDICVSVHSAFDSSWKTDYPFYEWDIYTGLISDSGVPNPAAIEITKRQP
jgi:exo-beta-1,3-glucanase (GH17 family)